MALPLLDGSAPRLAPLALPLAPPRLPPRPSSSGPSAHSVPPAPPPTLPDRLDRPDWLEDRREPPPPVRPPVRAERALEVAEVMWLRRVTNSAFVQQRGENETLKGTPRRRRERLAGSKLDAPLLYIPGPPASSLLHASNSVSPRPVRCCVKRGAVLLLTRVAAPGSK